MGFKTEQFVENVDENLKCSICLDVLEDPYQCKHGYMFCKGCVTRCLETRQICPECKSVLQIKDLGRCLRIKNMIENFGVYCHPPKSDEQAAAKEEENKLKCDWTGKLQSLAKHRETCPFQQVQCPNVGCNTNMQRRELEDHDKICKYKWVECDKCGKALLRRRLPGHVDFDCPEEMVPCSNICRNPETRQINKMRRIDVQDHVTNDCPKTVVDCPYKEHGCGVKVERQDVEKHVQENMAGHMMLLAKECSALKQENRCLKEEVKKRDDLLRTYTWKIKDYHYHNRRASGIDYSSSMDVVLYTQRTVLKSLGVYPPNIKLRSPTFWLCGYNWYLLLCPDGDNEDNKGYVSVYLCKDPDNYGSSESSGARSSVEEIHTPNSGVSVTCRLSVMSQKPGFPDFSSQKTGVLTNSMYKKCVIGWTRFMRSAEAVSDAYCVKPRTFGIPEYGSLTIQCTIQLDKSQ